MKIKKFLPTLALFLMFIGIASATITINKPEANATLSGADYFFNVTTDLTTDNCSFHITADGIFGLNTTNATEHTFRFPTANLTDASTTTLTVNCSNTTTDNETATQTITVDNTQPTAKLEISRAVIEAMNPLDTDCSGSSDAIDSSLSYLQTIYDTEGNNISDCTSSTCDWDNGYFDEHGEYYANCTVTDNGGNNKSATEYFTVKSGTVNIIPKKRKEIKDDNTIAIVGLIAILTLVAVVVAIIAVKKKK